MNPRLRRGYSGDRRQGLRPLPGLLSSDDRVPLRLRVAVSGACAKAFWCRRSRYSAYPIFCPCL